VLIFDQSGNFLDEWTQFGRPSGMFIDDNDLLYVADSSSSNTPRSNPGFEEGIRVGNVMTREVLTVGADEIFVNVVCMALYL